MRRRCPSSWRGRCGRNGARWAWPARIKVAGDPAAGWQRGSDPLESPLSVEAQLIERAIAGAAGATVRGGSLGVGTSDPGAAVVHLLVLVDQGEVERLDRLVGDADVEVLVFQVRGHVFAQIC